jgi:ligand-binding sensor domain-containing protein
MRVTVLAVFFFQVLAISCMGQQDQSFIFENYNSEQGLSQNSCFAIEQDKAGFMWFATQDGLNRFDGRNFKIFLPQNKEATGLPSNYITALKYNSRKKILLVGTQKGLCVYNSDGDSIEKFSKRFPYAAALDSIPVRKFFSFVDSEYWVISDGWGVFYIDEKNNKVQQLLNWNETKKIVSGIASHNGEIIIATQTQLFKALSKGSEIQLQPLMQSYTFPDINSIYSYDNSLWVGTLYSDCYQVKDINSKPVVTKVPVKLNGVGPFVTDADNNLWIGSRGNGVLHLIKKTGEWITSAHNPFNNRSLAKNFVLSLFRDRQGIIWCGMSGGGFAKYDPATFQFHTLGGMSGLTTSLPDNMVLDIYNAGGNKFYVGTQNKGLIEYDAATKMIQSFRGSSVLRNVNNTIYDITSDVNGNLWVAGWAGLMKVDTRSKGFRLIDGGDIIESKKLYVLHKLKKSDSLFIAGENGPIFFSLKDEQWKFCSPEVLQMNIYPGRYVYEGDDGVLWICSSGAGLIRYEYKKNKIEKVGSVNKLSSSIRYLYPSGNHYWLATDVGVLIYDVQADSIIRHITLKEANRSNVCYAIQKDSAGFFWVSSNTGLLRINPKDYAIKYYDKGNGMEFLEFNTAAVSKTNDGTLYFGGVGGITWFNPVNIKEYSYAPSPLITQLDVNGATYNTNSAALTNGKIQLAYKQNFIRILFCVNNFSNQYKNSFAYKLSSVDNDWVMSGPQDFANYTSLSPGTYEFKLKAANSDGTWGTDITTLIITIARPWWQTWWFGLGMAMLIGLIIFYFINNRIKTIRKQASFKHQLAEAEMQALRAQMNPHFIFNSLNAINRYILKSDKAAASSYLTKFSKLIRCILDNSRQQRIPLSQEIEALELYLSLESLRFQENFMWKIVMDEEMSPSTLFIPPMTIQPFVENAIWHGLLPKKGDCNLVVSFIAGKKEYTCIVEDNGIGRSGSSELKQDSVINKSSVGISATARRLKLMTTDSDEMSHVHLEDLYDEMGRAVGTKVIIKIPYLYV